MPAIITHHIFGEDASALLPDGIIDGQEDLLAFLLGNQGSDPMRLRVSCLPMQARTCRMLAERVHAGRVVDALMSLRDAVSRLPERDRTVGRAFALGMLAHYLLDSFCNPLIRATEHDLIEADPSLAAHADEVRSIIVADIDSWMLWQKRQQTFADSPCEGALTSTRHVDGVAGTMIAQMSWEVFGIDIGATEYGRAVEDMRLAVRLADAPEGAARGFLAGIHGGRRILAMAHRPIEGDDCALANLDHHLWRDPLSGERSIASIADLFHDALIAWPVLAKRYVEGDRERLVRMVGDVNYHGTRSDDQAH